MTKDVGQPFGKPFHYTDDLPLSSDPRPRWYQRLWRAVRPQKHPLAWVVSEPEEDKAGIRAYIMLNDGELRVSAVEPASIVPIYDEDLLLALMENLDDNAQPNKQPGKGL